MVKRFFGTIKKYKDLIWHLIIFDMKSSVARTYLGFLWWLLEPLLYMLVYYFLVQVILQRGGPDYAVFLFSALIPLKWTTSCLTFATTSISANSPIIRQIYVPKMVFVIVRLGTNTLNYLIGLLVLILFLKVYGIQLSFNILYLPLIMVIHGFLLFGMMLILSHIGVYIKDIKNMMQYVARLLLYLSPVLYSIDSVPENYAKFLYLNPLTTILESYRNILLYKGEPNYIGLICILFLAILLISVGLRVVMKYDKKYAKVI